MKPKALYLQNPKIILIPVLLAGADQADDSPNYSWQNLPSWRVLDTSFDHGFRFFRTWHAWRQDPRRSRMLHYLAFAPDSLAGTDLSKVAVHHPFMAPLVQALAQLWYGLLPGFHRFLLDQGQVTLTLCVGPSLNLLRQQRFEADAIEITQSTTHTDDASLWKIKALSRCCRRGTVLGIHAQQSSNISELRKHLNQSGFEWVGENRENANCELVCFQALYNPQWVIKNSRPNAVAKALPVGRCAVIGAGLAGASVAAALARRGWQVQVLDQAEAPAAGASGLPVGLIVPHVSGDDCGLSRLSRSGARMMLQQARSLLVQGQDWSPSGTLERHIGGTPKLPDKWPNTGQEWSELVQHKKLPQVDSKWSLGLNLKHDLWHSQAAWIKPGELVRAWLAQAGVQFQGQAKVVRLNQRADGIWDLINTNGEVLCSAERVVLANACGAAALLNTLQLERPDIAPDLRRLPTMQGMHGLLSWAMHADVTSSAFPVFPVNGSGSVVPWVPMDGGSAWYMGSSYQPASQTERSDKNNTISNLEHLQQLLPELATQLKPAFELGQLNRWKNTRCVTSDRLPVVGALQSSEQPGLWICAGVGSRGLSFSVLCAELLAARWGAEPLPVESGLARSLEALRC